MKLNLTLLSRRFITIGFVLLFISCNPGTISVPASRPLLNEIRQSIFDEEGVVKLKQFKVESFTITDTITVQDRIHIIESTLENLYFKKDLQAFKEDRNREFTDFHGPDLFPNYEYKVLKGELKDASSWCTEIRRITEKADSLIKAWENVSPYDYDYIYCKTWYLKRYQHFYGYYSDEFQTEIVLNTLLPKYKDICLEHHTLSSLDTKQVLYYDTKYQYTYFDPVIKNTVRKIKDIKLSKDFKSLYGTKDD